MTHHPCIFVSNPHGGNTLGCVSATTYGAGPHQPGELEIQSVFDWRSIFGSSLVRLWVTSDLVKKLGFETPKDAFFKQIANFALAG